MRNEHKFESKDKKWPKLPVLNAKVLGHKFDNFIVISVSSLNSD